MLLRFEWNPLGMWPKQKFGTFAIYGNSVEQHLRLLSSYLLQRIQTDNLQLSRKELYQINENWHSSCQLNENYHLTIVCLDIPDELRFTPVSVQTHISSEDFEGI